MVERIRAGLRGPEQVLCQLGHPGRVQEEPQLDVVQLPGCLQPMQGKRALSIEAQKYN